MKIFKKIFIQISKFKIINRILNVDDEDEENLVSDEWNYHKDLAYE
jgi:hypothetical protein